MTVLWIHGFPLSSHMFEGQHAIEGVTHVMPDLPGFGSTLPADGEPSVDEYARSVVSQLDASKIEKAVFAGFSMGGYVCFSVLRLFPERVAGLILIDTKETADSDEARKGRFDSIAKVESEGVGPVVESMLPKMLTSKASPELKTWVRDLMMATPPQGAIDALRAMASRPDSTPLLPTISVPALIVVGEEDPITPPADAERMAKAIPGAKLVKIRGAAHLSNVERPEEFNLEVGRFLRSLQ